MYYQLLPGVMVKIQAYKSVDQPVVDGSLKVDQKESRQRTRFGHWPYSRNRPYVNLLEMVSLYPTDLFFILIFLPIKPFYVMQCHCVCTPIIPVPN